METPALIKLELPKGYAWRGPQDAIREGDEVLIWDASHSAPAWFKARLMIGSTPESHPIFVRHKVEGQPKQPKKRVVRPPTPTTEDTGALPE